MAVPRLRIIGWPSQTKVPSEQYQGYGSRTTAQMLECLQRCPEPPFVTENLYSVRLLQKPVSRPIRCEQARFVRRVGALGFLMATGGNRPGLFGCQSSHACRGRHIQNYCLVFGVSSRKTFFPTERSVHSMGQLFGRGMPADTPG